MTYKFEIKEYDEIPVVPRGGQGLPFPWDTLKVKKGFYVPRDFWVTERGIPAGEIKPADLKDRIRRSFYNWRDDEDHKTERKNLRVVLVDKKEKDGAYLGVEVVMASVSGAAEARPPKKK